MNGQDFDADLHGPSCIPKTCSVDTVSVLDAVPTGGEVALGETVGYSCTEDGWRLKNELQCLSTVQSQCLQAGDLCAAQSDGAYAGVCHEAGGDLRCFITAGESADRLLSGGGENSLVVMEGVSSGPIDQFYFWIFSFFSII